MIKKITLLLFFVFALAPVCNGFSQSLDGKIDTQDPKIMEHLSIYPNPVSTGKVYIQTENNFTKQIAIFNVLGKEIFSTTISGKELNISKLKAGVYIIKITENNISATRKLIVK